MNNVGMYGGSFDPIHMGHVNQIVKASSSCKELHIVLSYSKSRDKLDYKQRFQWLVEVTKDLENVSLHVIEDSQESKETYDWEYGANEIRKAVGKRINVVFCGSDYKGTNKFEQLYKESKVVYMDRGIVDISSTQIRNNPYKYWEYIPNIVKPYYTKKVLVLGGESTGKSTLVGNLANVFNTVYVEEVGRTVCERAQQEEMMLESDFYEIMIRHKELEYRKLREANKVLFIDTDCLTTLFYQEFLYENSSNHETYKRLANAMNSLNSYDLILFLEVAGTEFIQDGTRNSNIEADRQKYSDMLENTLMESKVNYKKIGGDYNDRLNKSIQLVNTLFSV